MRHLQRIPVVVLLLVCFLGFAHPNAARAAAITTTNSSYFNSQLAAGSFTTNISSLGQGLLPNTETLSGNGFTYDVTSVLGGGLFGIPTGLTTNANGSTLRFDFTSGYVTAVGGDFFSTDATGALDGGSVTLVLSDGSTITINNSSLTSFAGFLSPGVFITRLNITPGAASYATADFTVGDVVTTNGSVPEPATFGLLGAGLFAGGLLRKRLSPR